MVWSDGSYVLEERRSGGALFIALTRLDDAHFEAVMDLREPGGRCIAFGDVETSSFQCFEPGRDEWVVVDLRRSPDEVVISAGERSAGVDVGFLSETLTLHPAAPIDLVERFVRDSLGAVEPSCDAEGGGDDVAGCPVLGGDASARLHRLVNRMRERQLGAYLAPADAFLTLRRLLRLSVRACDEGPLTIDCIDEAIGSFFRSEDDPNSISLSRNTAPVRAEIASEPRGVWMPATRVAGFSDLDSIEISADAQLPAGTLRIDIRSNGQRCGLIGTPPGAVWQTLQCGGQDYRVRLVEDRLELRQILDDGSLVSNPYRTYRRVDVLRESLARIVRGVGQPHGGETTAVLGSIVDAVMGDAPVERGEHVYSALRDALVAQQVPVDELTFDDAVDLLGSFLLSAGVSCMRTSNRMAGPSEPCDQNAGEAVLQECTRAQSAAFSSCIDATLLQVADAHARDFAEGLGAQ